MFIVWWQVDFFWENSRGTNFKGNSMSVSSYSQTGTSHRPNDFFNTILFYHHYAYSTTDTSSARNFNYFNISFPRTLHVSGQWFLTSGASVGGGQNSKLNLTNNFTVVQFLFVHVLYSVQSCKISITLSSLQSVICFSVRWMDLVWDSSSVVQSFNHSCMCIFYII